MKKNSDRTPLRFPEKLGYATISVADNLVSFVYNMLYHTQLEVPRHNKQSPTGLVGDFSNFHLSYRW